MSRGREFWDYFEGSYWANVQQMRMEVLEGFFGKCEQYFQEETPDFRRIELGFAATEAQKDICMKMYSYLSSISCIPWREISFLGHGHTIPCNVIEGFSAVWLLDSRLLPQIAAPVYPEFMGDKINYETSGALSPICSFFINGGQRP